MKQGGDFVQPARHSDIATRCEHHHDVRVCECHLFNVRILPARETKRPIESFSFRVGVKSYAQHDRIRRRRDLFRRFGNRLRRGSDSKPRRRGTRVFKIFEPKVVGLLGFQVRRVGIEGFPVPPPIVDDQCLIEEDPYSIVS